MQTQKLQLTWIGKERWMRLEPRILVEDPEKSYGDSDSGNMLIHGDNLLALKALEQEYSGKVKCIYIDPPYNTGNAFEYYDDWLEHSEWLNLMRPRLDILRRLLSNDGIICVHIDDSEWHYLKCLMDECFWRDNYLVSFYVKVRYAEKTLKQDMVFNKEIEQVLIYRKSPLAKPIQQSKAYDYWKFCYRIEELWSGREEIIWGKKVIVFNQDEYRIVEYPGDEYGLKEIWASGTILDGNSSGRFFRDYLDGRYENDGYWVLYKVAGIGDDRYDHRYFTWPKKVWATKGKYYQWVPKNILESEDSVSLKSISNFYDFSASFWNCRHEWWVGFRGGKKPESLIKMLLDLCTKPGDLVLDSFLGSWTTVAVAHKMGRKWIGIELWDHAYSLSKTRIDTVIDGDSTGISKEVLWKWGGGYRFYELGPSVLARDDRGRYVINPNMNGEMLVRALCKIENFRYSPKDGDLIRHGHSTERDFIHITTRLVDQDTIDRIASKSLKENESLLIMAKSVTKDLRLPLNVQVKKIPNEILRKCEYAKDDYSLPILSETQEKLADLKSELAAVSPNRTEIWE